MYLAANGLSKLLGFDRPGKTDAESDIVDLPRQKWGTRLRFAMTNPLMAVFGTLPGSHFLDNSSTYVVQHPLASVWSILLAISDPSSGRGTLRNTSTREALLAINESSDLPDVKQQPA
jgi:hypothetical protein